MSVACTHLAFSCPTPCEPSAKITPNTTRRSLKLIHSGTFPVILRHLLSYFYAEQCSSTNYTPSARDAAH